MAKILLLVEGDPITLALSKAVLEGAGHQVISSDAVDQFYHLMDRNLPQLMVLDIHLPGSPAYALLRKVRIHPEYGRIPVLFLAGRNSIQDRLTGFRHGADAYLTKPFQPDHLLKSINNLDRFSVTEETGIHGLFECYPFLDLLQILGRRKRTGTLTLTDLDRPSGVVNFQQGLVHAAQLGPLKGDDAFLDLLETDRGGFSFEDHGPSTLPKDCHRQTDLQILLLESAWLRKETARHSGDLDLNRRSWWVLAEDHPPPPPRLEKLPIQPVIEDLSLHPGSYLKDISQRCAKSKGRVGLVLSWLWSMGMVSPSNPADSAP